MEQVFQLAGAFAILAAFIAVQRKYLDPLAWPTLILNLTGAGVLAVVAALDRDWGFLLLEGVWAIVTLGSIITRVRAKKQPPP